jgi:ABC-type sugar transport system permease subunit
MPETSDSSSSKTTRQNELILSLLTGWRALFSLIALVGALGPWVGLLPELKLWQGILTSIVLGLAAVFSALAAFDIRKRNHRGRTISLFIDYLGLVTAIIVVLQTSGVFIGIDALAQNFGRGIPFLGLAFAGYLISAAGDYFPNQVKTEKLLRQIGNWLAIAGGLIFLFAVDILSGLLGIISGLSNVVGLISVLALIIFSLAIWGMWRAPSALALNAKTSHEQMLNGWLFLSPNLLGFLIFFAGPLLLSLYFSFTNSDAFNPPQWVGLDNYAKILNVTIKPLASPTQLAKEVLDIKTYDEVGRFLFGQGGIVFGAEDKIFWLALKNTLVYALFAVPFSVIPALLLANVLNSKLPGMKFFRAVYFIPSIAAIVGISLVWQWLYNATIGYINYFITLGIQFWNTLFNAGVIDPKINWVSDEKTALMAIIIIAAWQTMGFNTVLFLAGLQNIPGELYEAATVDGAGAWDKFWRITLPMLAPTTFYVVSTTTIQAMQVFEQVFILMNPPEGPNNSTITLVLYLYRSGFQNFKQGYASALAWVLFIVIFGLTLFQFQRQRQSSAYEG